MLVCLSQNGIASMYKRRKRFPTALVCGAPHFDAMSIFGSVFVSSTIHLGTRRHYVFREVVYGITMYQISNLSFTPSPRPGRALLKQTLQGLMQQESPASLCFASEGLITIGPEENKGGLHVIDM